MQNSAVSRGKYSVRTGVTATDKAPPHYSREFVAKLLSRYASLPAAKICRSGVSVRQEKAS